MLHQLVDTIVHGHQSPIDKDALIQEEAETLPLDKAKPDNLSTASFGMGCFWGPDAVFGSINGIYRTRVGYAGGNTSRPSYHDLDGHTETVQIDFDPASISYEDLLEIFWTNHRPTVKQKTQYKSILFFHTEKQRKAAEKSLNEMKENAMETIETTVQEIEAFHPAELYHQKYHLREHGTVLKEMQSVYSSLAIVNSTVAARLNGIAAGQVGKRQLEKEANTYGLPAETISLLSKMIDG